MMTTILRRTSLLGVLLILSAVLTAPASAAEPGPVWIAPAAGQALSIENGVTLQVQPPGLSCRDRVAGS